MKYTGSILFIAIGALLYFAVTADVQGFDISTGGLVLVVIGLIWLVITVIYDISAASRKNQARPTNEL